MIDQSTKPSCQLGLGSVQDASHVIFGIWAVHHFETPQKTELE